jgi:hypothetical protein
MAEILSLESKREVITIKYFVQLIIVVHFLLSSFDDDNIFKMPELYNACAIWLTWL